ncbi:hypothetical protein [Helicobacter sp. 11S02596-1]|uniref:hypothetical protein n=1 Tax=Helicobacter sp. 11S02596-1 TaxID=1476194 RepID=UPI000BA6B9D3|nr:hypothetical protein [Helicobacter sp. 11S02596-1]PAF45091.1 hypothetical protein BJI48_00540 [Helicobacter sp. 11S02596-1]
MKISIMCQSTLLQEALSYYLKDSLSDFEGCDFVISDMPMNAHKPVCLITADQNTNICKPFTQASLLRDIQTFYHSKIKPTKITNNAITTKLLENPELKTQIDLILEEFSKKIYQTLKNQTP